MTNESGDTTSPHIELPDPPREGKPVIPPPPGRAFRTVGETSDPTPDASRGESEASDAGAPKRSRNRRRRRGGKGRNRSQGRDRADHDGADRDGARGNQGSSRGDRNRGGRRGGGRSEEQIEAELVARRRGKERDGRPLGRYLMCVHVHDDLTQVSVLEGRNLIEHYVSRPADDVYQIHEIGRAHV